MKRIVIFADGTWNSPEKGLATNVLRMARGIKPLATGIEQVVFYDWGVGTDRKTFSGGITGAGMDKNIQDCYRFIIHNYKIGDQLFFFGFSRGAYTVRSLAGFIRNCGILKREHADRIPDAYKLYRKRHKASAPNAAMAKKFRANYAVADVTTIEFLGVWDTVGALGVPVPFLGMLGKHEYLFHDLEPSSIIKHARHAVSIDENRKDFMPSLWEKKDGLDLKQVWFAGVHSDIGGGYKEDGLSSCACKWMIQEATACGLAFETHFVRAIQPDPLAKQHNEYKGVFKAMGKETRQISGPIHISVKKRWDNNAYDYQKKSRALKNLLETVDWEDIELITD